MTEQERRVNRMVEETMPAKADMNERLRRLFAGVRIQRKGWKLEERPA